MFEWKKKHVGMSRFQTRETCFVPLSLLDALNDSSPVEPRYSRQCLIVIVALCIFSYLRQMAPFWLQKDIFIYFFFLLNLSKLLFIKADGGQILFEAIFKHYNSCTCILCHNGWSTEMCLHSLILLFVPYF